MLMNKSPARICLNLPRSGMLFVFQVMLGGGWFDRLLTESGDLPDEAAVAAMAKKAACEQLGISPDLQPSKVNVAYHKVGSERSCFTVPVTLLGIQMPVPVH